jgi:mannosyltransferase
VRPPGRVDRLGVGLLPPVLLTAALGLCRASSIVLWWDELSTLDVARRSAGGILATAHNVDAMHAFHYLFMHLWIGLFGSSPLTLRPTSVLALIPGVARYACEARSYGFVVLGSAAALLLLCCSLRGSGPGSHRNVRPSPR